MAKNNPTRNLTPGQRFHYLLVLCAAEKSEKGAYQSRCQCDCGSICTVTNSALRAGTTKSCGCLRREKAAQNGRATRTHGMKHTPEYVSWGQMIQRCTNPKHHAYRHYGGRGITVCDRWRYSFENFLADMGKRTSLKHSIERRNNELGYTPENCYWATMREQLNNTRWNRFISYQGQTLTVAQWAEQLGLHYTTMRARFRKMSVEIAITKTYQSSNRLISHQGQTRTVLQWADFLGLPYYTMRRRFLRMSVERALTEPLNRSKSYPGPRPHTSSSSSSGTEKVPNPTFSI